MSWIFARWEWTSLPVYLSEFANITAMLMDMATVGWTLWQFVAIETSDWPIKKLGKPANMIWSWIWWKQIPDKLYQTYWPVRNLEIFFKFKIHVSKMLNSYYDVWFKQRIFNPRDSLAKSCFNLPQNPSGRNPARTSMRLSCSQVSQALFNKDNEVGQMFCWEMPVWYSIRK